MEIPTKDAQNLSQFKICFKERWSLQHSTLQRLDDCFQGIEGLKVSMINA